MPIDHVNRVTTTSNIGRPRYKCANCGVEVPYFAIDPNGRLVCKDCAGPHALIDVLEVDDAPQVSPPEG